MGSVPTGADGVYCTIGGRTSLDIVKEAAAGAKAIVAWGSCASNGCIQAASPNPTGATPVHQIITDKPIIKVPGCPPIGEVMAATIVHLLTFGTIPELDRTGRPKAFYSRRVHDTCYRRPAYDAGLFVESWDDENAKKGYCLYKMGCRGPVTYNACAVTKWNGGVSFPVQSGHGCLGCSEANFWDNGPFYEHLTNLDALVFDIQDIGTRYYTYVWTMALAMEACAETGVRFVVLDRPNPIGIHQVKVLEVDGARIRVADMEAVDRTPIIDVKPILDPEREP